MTHLLPDGKVLAGRYKIISFLAEGGMQEVYTALDVPLGRIVALKAPKNNSAKKRFQRSAAVSARVTHPNVAKTFDYVETEGQQYLVEEFIPGEDLGRRLLSYFSLLDPHLVAHLFHHLAKALAAVHKEEVIHRDLKPSNIMISSDCNMSVLKVTDFGIAKMAAAEIEDGVRDETLASQTVVGALPYMAPEVIQNRHDVSTSADVWSVGAILFQLFSGDRPFGEGLPAVHKILAGQLPQRPSSGSPGYQFKHLEDDIWRIVQRCLQMDATARPSASSLVDMGDSLCYSRSDRAVGNIQKFAEGSGAWGFIESRSYSDVTFFHKESAWGWRGGVPARGQRVCFARYAGDPRPRAHPVLLLRDAQ